MPSSQWELGFFRVVEGATLLEAHRRVTRGAIRSKGSLVLIIDTVAVDAGCRHAFVQFIWMTSAAGDGLVFPGEWIFSLRVIEFSAAPPLFAVTVSAVLSQLARMAVFGLVAAVALTRCIAMLRLGIDRVATRAGGPPVSADQGVVGDVVIEAVRIETEDVVSAALVFGVAAAARQTLGATIATVKSLARGSVTGHVFMAEHAQRGLSSGLEWAVALAAVVLDLCVRLGYGARHH